MKRTIQFCYAILIILMIWSCCPPEPKKVVAISIAELAVQGLLQNTDVDSTLINKELLDRIRRARYFELNFLSLIAVEQPAEVYSAEDGCCPCDSTFMASKVTYKANWGGDLCCPCPSRLRKFEGGSDIISPTPWEAMVGLKSSSDKEATPLNSTTENDFQFFSLKGVKDGDYQMIMKGPFAPTGITLNVNIQDGNLRYKP